MKNLLFAVALVLPMTTVLLAHDDNGNGTGNGNQEKRVTISIVEEWDVTEFISDVEVRVSTENSGEQVNVTRNAGTATFIVPREDTVITITASKDGYCTVTDTRTLDAHRNRFHLVLRDCE